MEKVCTTTISIIMIMHACLDVSDLYVLAIVLYMSYTMASWTIAFELLVYEKVVHDNRSYMCAGARARVCVCVCVCMCILSG